ncbi:CLUMA_CG008626, isoform A [Clunio marinus]|uniref:CLUMA_CG008626, isoform A n=1 Tax=Clunio marinus TaxID=568069 RepID=A0A1J1I4D5_9DIPT|nr:CLUMA_CG008626, isoform A [Clunio marinus]
MFKSVMVMNLKFMLQAYTVEVFQHHSWVNSPSANINNNAELLVFQFYFKTLPQKFFCHVYVFETCQTPKKCT